MIHNVPVDEYKQRREQVQITAKLLEFLVELLYPHADEESPEIIRLKDVACCYRPMAANKLPSAAVILGLFHALIDKG